MDSRIPVVQGVFYHSWGRNVAASYPARPGLILEAFLQAEAERAPPTAALQLHGCSTILLGGGGGKRRLEGGSLELGSIAG